MQLLAPSSSSTNRPPTERSETVSPMPPPDSAIGKSAEQLELECVVTSRNQGVTTRTSREAHALMPSAASADSAARLRAR